MVRSVSAFGGAALSKKKIDLGDKGAKVEERIIFSSTENGAPPLL